MQWRSLQIFACAWLVVCFGAIVPGHAHVHGAEGGAAHHDDGDHRSQHHHHGKTDCSVCYLASQLFRGMPSEPVVLQPERTIERVFVVRTAAEPVITPLPFSGRAPPFFSI